MQQNLGDYLIRKRCAIITQQGSHFNSHHSVQSLSCRFLSKNLKIKLYETIILPVVMHE